MAIGTNLIWSMLPRFLETYVKDLMQLYTIEGVDIDKLISEYKVLMLLWL